MEVHHHAHDPEALHHRKKWRAYFWEFLMLFLAVFCGFLAEYQLEHVIENQREMRFIKSLQEDLQEDITLLDESESRNQRIIAAADTLRRMIQAGSRDVGKMYELNISSLAGFGTVFTDRTSAQLKYAGAMRLIRNGKVADAIVRYWSLQSLAIAIQDDAKGLRTRAREQSYMIFDNKYYTDTLVDGKRHVAENASLMVNDYNTIAEFGNRISHFKNLLQTSYSLSLDNARTAANALMALIEEEYHLD